MNALAAISDQSSIDDQWIGLVGILVCVVLIITLGVIERRRQVAAKEAEAHAYYERRQAEKAASHVPYGERCMVPSCTNRAEPDPYDRWRRCAGCKTRVGGGAA